MVAWVHDKYYQFRRVPGSFPSSLHTRVLDRVLKDRLSQHFIGRRGSGVMDSSWTVAAVFVTNSWIYFATRGRSLFLLVVVVVFDQAESN